MRCCSRAIIVWVRMSDEVYYLGGGHLGWYYLGGWYYVGEVRCITWALVGILCGWAVEYSSGDWN